MVHLAVDSPTHHTKDNNTELEREIYTKLYVYRIVQTLSNYWDSDEIDAVEARAGSTNQKHNIRTVFCSEVMVEYFLGNLCIDDHRQLRILFVVQNMKSNHTECSFLNQLSLAPGFMFGLRHTL